MGELVVGVVGVVVSEGGVALLLLWSVGVWRVGVDGVVVVGVWCCCWLSPKCLFQYSNAKARRCLSVSGLLFSGRGGLLLAGRLLRGRKKASCVSRSR